MGLTAKQADFVKYYADTGSESHNNAYQSAIRAGYAHKTANNSMHQVLGNIGVKAAISGYKQEIAKQLDHNRTIAIDLLTANLARAQAKADNGDIQAIGAITAIVRELNSISALHSQTVNTGAVEATALTPEQAAKARAAAEAVTTPKLKLA